MSTDRETANIWDYLFTKMYTERRTSLRSKKRWLKALRKLRKIEGRFDELKNYINGSGPRWGLIDKTLTELLESINNVKNSIDSEIERNNLENRLRSLEEEKVYIKRELERGKR